MVKRNQAGRVKLDKRIAEAILEAAKRGPSVGSLVKEVAEGLGVKEHIVAKHLYLLWRDGELELADPNPPSSLARYAISSYNLWFWAVAALVFTVGLSIYLLPQSPPYIYLRYLVGSLFVLYLPGFALVEALYPRREDLEPLERLALSIGLSLALVPLVGLLLNYTPWGIRLGPIFISLSLLTLALSIVAVARKFSYFKMRIEAAVEK